MDGTPGRITSAHTARSSSPPTGPCSLLVEAAAWLTDSRQMIQAALVELEAFAGGEEDADATAVRLARQAVLILGQVPLLLDAAQILTEQAQRRPLPAGVALHGHNGAAVLG